MGQGSFLYRDKEFSFINSIQTHYRGFMMALRHTTLDRLLWRSDQPDADTSTWQHTTLTETDFHATGGIRTRNPSKWAAADSCLRPRSHWDRL